MQKSKKEIRDETVLLLMTEIPAMGNVYSDLHQVEPSSSPPTTWTRLTFWVTA